MSRLDLYSTVLAGRRRYRARDVNGSVAQHVACIDRMWGARVMQFLAANAGFEVAVRH